jgi:hypothetical protein
MKKNNKYRFELGQDLLEFALIVPILFLILIMIFDLGRVVYYYSVLTNSAREGARAAIIDNTETADIQNAVCQLALGLDLGCPNPSITVTNLDLEPDTENRPDHVRVGVVYQFQPVTPLVKYFLGMGASDSITLNSQATMRLEH